MNLNERSREMARKNNDKTISVLGQAAVEVEVDISEVVGQCDCHQIMDEVYSTFPASEILSYIPVDEVAEYAQEMVKDLDSIENHLEVVTDATYESLVNAVIDGRLDMVKVFGMVTVAQLKSMTVSPTAPDA
jgi:hypothetical protein